MIRVLFLVSAIFISLLNGAEASPHFREGDIIFQTSKSAQSEAVQKATRSTFSHMGVILEIDKEACVFEAVSIVKCTPLKAWIARGEKGHFIVKRTKKDLLSSEDTKRHFYAIAKSFEGRPYDLTFEWSDSRIYCSELVWKIYDRAFGVQIGQLARLRDFDLTSTVVQRKIKERYNGKPPLDESVISPESMFNSPLLFEVARG